MNKRNIPAMTWRDGKVIPTTIEEIRKRMKPLSKEAQEARKPIPPEYLVDALQDPIHKEVGRSRAAWATKRKSK